MNWDLFLRNKKVQSILSILLVAALLLGIGIPAGQLTRAVPEDPLQGVRIQDIDPLYMGDGKETPEEETDPENTEDNPEGGGAGADSGEKDSGKKKQKETRPEPTEAENDQQGQEAGNKGEEGGEEVLPDLSMVMTWYKYGSQPQMIVCTPSETVAKKLNTAQLVQNNLEYSFDVAGEGADSVTVTEVLLKEGDGAYEKAAESGSIGIQLPEGGARDYTFQIKATYKKRNDQGNQVQQELRFTYILQCSYSMDLEMELSWEKKNQDADRLLCAANDTAEKTVRCFELNENVFAYTPKLLGNMAKGAQILSGEYSTASGDHGALAPEGGSVLLRIPEGAKEETYYLTFAVRVTDQDKDTQTVYFRYTIVYSDTQDIALSFVWLEKGVTPRTLICQPDGQAAVDVKNNQLSAGAVKYEMELTGSGIASARIMNASYTSEASGGGSLETSGAIPMTLPEGCASNTYTVTVIVLANGQRINYEIKLTYSMDIRLEMTYSVLENGVPATRLVTCENGRTQTAEAIYDDQLTNGRLSYGLSVAGKNTLRIKRVSCYQSGSGRSVNLSASGELELLLKNGRTGENTVTVAAEDADGAEYEFKISIPYKHRGENSVRIVTNLTEGQMVVNETVTNLRVSAWSEDGAGNVVSQIPANGVDTKLIVTLDGDVIQYASSSGDYSEYKLRPENPQVGDRNDHILRIYAEDELGNYGELTINLIGQRSQPGQRKGSATIYVDLTVLGLGVVASVPYEVLADEPISYSIAKAILGEDTGDPFGAAENALGWRGRYAGTKDTGFYLESLTPGYAANTLEGSSWNKYGSSEDEILEAIDAHFGRGTGLATLWRCIYRNGLNKSGGSNGAFGEFDYTSGSGWLFSLGGTYFPGLSMSEYSLEDGDVLTLRYTLAYGWDVGGGTEGYGNTTGYCVKAVNGRFDIRHRMKEVPGSNSKVCSCCGLVEDCAHGNTAYQDLGDGTHSIFCLDCDKTLGDPQPHDWEQNGDDHTCKECGTSEAHYWKEVEGTNTATCTQSGVRTISCRICKMEKQEECGPKGHKLNNRWNHTKTHHYQKCSVCSEDMMDGYGKHRYRYDPGDDDWYCEVCEAGHDWDYCGNDDLQIKEMTCLEIVYHCDTCKLDLTKKGQYPEHHSYANGHCRYCGEEDPYYVPPETDPPQTDPPETEPPQTDPPETEPPQTDPSETEPPQTDPPETEPPQTDPPETDPPQTDPPEPDPPAEDPPVEAQSMLSRIRMKFVLWRNIDEFQN